MPRDVVVMGASAGGVEALSSAVSGLPEKLEAAVFVVLHYPARSSTLLPEVLQRHTPLPTALAAEDEGIRTGRIYVAPPDHHLLLRGGRVNLSRGPKENGHRPAIDSLFRSAARVYGPRVVGVVLSGTLDDGSMGLRTIVSRGGLAVVQDPKDAAFPSMPENALDAVPQAVTLAARDIGGYLASIRDASAEAAETRSMPAEVPHLSDDTAETLWEGGAGEASVFTCPECHGTLFQVREESFERFRCRVGHGYSADSLLEGQSEALEAALWTALRTLEERNDLVRRLAQRARQQGQQNVAERFEERARSAETNLRLLRQVLLSGEASRGETA